MSLVPLARLRHRGKYSKKGCQSTLEKEGHTWRDKTNADSASSLLGNAD